MDLDKLEIDFSDGKIYINEKEIVSLLSCIEKMHDKVVVDEGWKLIFRKKEKIFRRDIPISWRGFSILSIVIIFLDGKIKSISFGFGQDEKLMSSIIDHPIMKEIFNFLPLERFYLKSKAEIFCATNYGKIIVRYDLHMLSIVLIVQFN